MLQRRHALDTKRRRRGGTIEEKWVKMHEQLARELNAADEGKGYDVLFYGDSILESTRCAALQRRTSGSTSSGACSMASRCMSSCPLHMTQMYRCSAMLPCRGTYLGAMWSEFRQVKEVWEELFAGKPYTTHTLAISGASTLFYCHEFACPCLATFIGETEHASYVALSECR